MQHFKNKIITALFLLFPVVTYAGLNQGFNRGYGGAGSAFDSFLSGEQNPANFSKIPTFLGGFYIAPQLNNSTIRSDSLTNNESGIFIAAPREKWGFYASLFGSSSEDNLNSDILKQWSMQGGSLGASYNLWPNLSLGIYSAFYSVGNPYMEINVGVLYRFPIDLHIAYGLGIYNVNFGLALNSSKMQLNKLNYPLGFTYPAMSLQLFHSKYVNLYYDNTISIAGEGRQVSFLNGFKFTIVNYLTLQAGFSGKDFFKSTFNYVGLGAKIPLHVVDFHLFMGFGSKDFYQLGSSIKNQFSLGGYFQYSLINSSYISKTDNNLTFLLEPKNIITPNGDGKNDFLKIHLLHGKYSKVLDWNLVILDSSLNEVVIVQPDILTRSPYGFFKFPKVVLWYGTNANGQRVKDGNYFFKMMVVLKNGERLKWEIGSILLDAQKPDFNMVIDNNNFFVGQAKPFVIRLFDKNQDIEFYNIRFLNIEGKPVYDKKITNFDRKTLFEWNGYVRGTQPIQSGSYSVQVWATDRAGNKMLRTKDDLYFYESKKVVYLKMPYSIFSPNNDNRKDILPIELEVPVKKYVKNWGIKFFSLTQRKVVREITGLNYIPQKVVWNGLTAEGTVATQGMYTVSFVVKLVTGQVLKSLVYKVILDNDSPFIKLDVRQPIFTPDNVGINDTVRIDIDYEDQSQISAYKIKIEDPRKKGKLAVIRTIQGKGNLPYFYIWDGLLNSGVKVDSFQDYYIIVEAMDRAGNVGLSNKVKIRTELLKNTMVNRSSLGNSKLKISFPNLNFQFGSAIPTPESMGILVKVNDLLKRYPRVKVEIVGHTDKIGTRDGNLMMSKQRAEYVKNYLMYNGISANRLTSTGKGFDEPIFPHNNPVLSLRNRRVEFIITNETFSKKNANK